MRRPDRRFDESCRRVAALLIAIAATATASDAFYLGAWKIVSAKPAPWGNTGAWKQSAAEAKSLVGRTVKIEAKAIRGPAAVACAKPTYKVEDYPADMLFQGMFGEMRARDNAADPSKIAESIGFRGSSWKTLETGCEGPLDFHFIDPETAAFGLNNYIYVLKKQR